MMRSGRITASTPPSSRDELRRELAKRLGSGTAPSRSPRSATKHKSSVYDSAAQRRRELERLRKKRLRREYKRLCAILDEQKALMSR